MATSERFQLTEEDAYAVVWDTEGVDGPIPAVISSDVRLARSAKNALRRGENIEHRWVEDDDEGIAYG